MLTVLLLLSICNSLATRAIELVSIRTEISFRWDLQTCTGWHIRLSQTSRWHQNKSSFLACPGQNRTFVLMSIGGLAQPDVSTCMHYNYINVDINIRLKSNWSHHNFITQLTKLSWPPLSRKRSSAWRARYTEIHGRRIFSSFHTIYFANQMDPTHQ